jgi:glycosyltransferase involved in cell wall biosynthesis
VRYQVLEEMISEARVFILHTQEESQGIVFCEAMAVGLPIISTSVGGVPHILTHNVNALLSSYGDVTAFSNHLVEFFSNPQLEADMTESNFIRSKLFSWKSIAKLVVSEYKCLY